MKDFAVMALVLTAEAMQTRKGSDRCGEERMGVHTNLDIQLLELVQVQPAGGAVFQEAFVPLLQLVFIKLCALHQILHHLGSQLAVLLSHGSCGARTRE